MAKRPKRIAKKYGRYGRLRYPEGESQPTEAGNAYGLIRVSTREQEERSPDWQEHEIARYCERNGLALIRTFRDTVSATKVPFEKRPSIIEAKAVVQPGDHIITWKLDRLSRNFLDSARVQIWCYENDLKLHVTSRGDGPIDWEDFDSETLYFVDTLAARQEARSTSERIKSRMKYQQKLGLPINGCPKPLHRTVCEWKKRGDGTCYKKIVGYALDANEVADMEWACRQEDNGMPMLQILRYLTLAGRKRANGRPYGSYRPPTNTRPLALRMDAYREMIAEGLEEELNEVQTCSEDERVGRRLLDLP